MRKLRAFTLVELLVVIGLLALVIGLLLPALNAVRTRATATKCLTQLRNLQQAHFMYMTDHDGYFIDVGLPHGGTGDEAELSWVNTLREYYGSEMTMRSPLDASPHWSVENGGEGVPIEGTTDQFRLTSYGCNEYLTRYSRYQAEENWRHERLGQVKHAAATAHFFIVAFEGPNAGTDHMHFTTSGPWVFDPPQAADDWIQINAVRGPEASWMGVSNYGFLDGHAETLTFAEVYQNPEMNRFDPEVSWQWTAQVADNFE